MFDPREIEALIEKATVPLTGDDLYSRYLKAILPAHLRFMSQEFSRLQTIPHSTAEVQEQAIKVIATLAHSWWGSISASYNQEAQLDLRSLALVAFTYDFLMRCDTPDDSFATGGRVEQIKTGGNA